MTTLDKDTSIQRVKKNWARIHLSWYIIVEFLQLSKQYASSSNHTSWARQICDLLQHHNLSNIIEDKTSV